MGRREGAVLNEKELVEQVLSMIQRELDLDTGDIDASSSRESTEFWDSLGHLRVCLALEGEFGIKIPMDAVERLGSVASIVQFLQSEDD